MRALPGMTVLLLSLGGVGFASWRVSRIFPGTTRSDRISFTLLFAAAGMIVFLFLLGAAGLLNAAGILGASTAAAGLSLLLPAGFAEDRRNASPAPSLLPEYRLPASLLLSFLIVQAVLGLLNPPFEYDSLAYHLPNAVHFLQNQSFLSRDTPFWFYPKFHEMLLAWLLGAAGGDIGVSLLNAGFLALALSSLEAIGEKCGLSQRASWTVVLVFATCPSTLWQLATSKNDLAMAAYLFASVNACLLLRGTRNGTFVLPASAAAAMALGTKYSGVYYAAVLLPAISWFAFRSSIHRSPATILGAAICLGGAGMWYLRTYLWTGNPFFPSEIGILGKTVFPGLPEFAHYGNTSLLSNASILVFLLLLRMIFRWGAAAGVLLVAGVFPFHRAGTAGAGPEERETVRLVWWIQLAFLFAFLQTPLSASAYPGKLDQVRYGLSLRYALPAIGLSLIPVLRAAAPFLDRIPARRILWGGVAVLALDTLINPASWLEPLAALSGLVWPTGEALLAKSAWFIGAGAFGIALATVLFFLLPRAGAVRSVGGLAASFLSILLLALSVVAARDSLGSRPYETVFERKSGNRTDVFSWSDRHLSGRSIAVYGMFSYPFAGRRFENRIHETEAGDREGWLREIGTKGIDTIVLTRGIGDPNAPAYGLDPPQAEWVKSFGDLPVYDDGMVRVFSITRRSAGPSKGS